jgi:hypothetical protein
MSKKKLGLIQSRGLGDIVISIPIAGYFRDQGYDILWPILEQFIPSLERNVPWVKWIPIPYDAPGRYFYDVPMQRLKNLGADETLPLYQHLTNHKFSEEKYFQFTKFDQYKYICSGVPFLNKWRLAEYITRDRDREQALYDQLVTDDNYVVVHRRGSDFEAQVDLSIVPNDWQIIEITEQTNCIFDWLTILEKSQSLILVDSVFANLVDQLNIGDDRYFIQRSHIGLTPVLGQHWSWLP